MGKNMSISLGDHFEGYSASQVETGRFGNRSEVIRDALRDHEERQHRVEALRHALLEGEQSGAYRPFTWRRSSPRPRRRQKRMREVVVRPRAYADLEII